MCGQVLIDKNGDFVLSKSPISISSEMTEILKVLGGQSQCNSTIVWYPCTVSALIMRLSNYALNCKNEIWQFLFLGYTWQPHFLIFRRIMNSFDIVAVIRGYHVYRQEYGHHRWVKRRRLLEKQATIMTVMPLLFWKTIRCVRSDIYLWRCQKSASISYDEKICYTSSLFNTLLVTSQLK